MLRRGYIRDVEVEVGFGGERWVGGAHAHLFRWEVIRVWLNGEMGWSRGVW